MKRSICANVKKVNVVRKLRDFGVKFLRLTCPFTLQASKNRFQIFHHDNFTLDSSEKILLSVYFIQSSPKSNFDQHLLKAFLRCLKCGNLLNDFENGRHGQFFPIKMAHETFSIREVEYIFNGHETIRLL